ncbi:MAG: stage III sporulation protein AD [Clostridium sp.]
MLIIKIIGFVFIALFLYLLMQETKPVVGVLLLLVAGAMIFMLMIGQLGEVINFIKEMSSKAGIDTVYIGIVLKIIGIAYLASFAAEICEDAKASSLKAKVEFSGKIMILALAIPILMAVLNSILQIL